MAFFFSGRLNLDVRSAGNHFNFSAKRKHVQIVCRWKCFKGPVIIYRLGGVGGFWAKHDEI